MTKYEKLFHAIAEQTPDGTEGKMFGAMCIKATNGRAAAIFWKGSMLFKLDEESQAKALNLGGAKVASHLYAPEKQMKHWVTIPKQCSSEWARLTKTSVKYVSNIS